ncbi:hypothetical protein PG637_07315 [Riemerella anatipestifer]|nr:hypothetical protein [Riemerella anatipestifer]MDY3325476.1 hypothetical protein [Riemerella anatipestifer]MDY3354121.1 hypothetical protein [Riemerella anatipestifer]
MKKYIVFAYVAIILSLVVSCNRDEEPTIDANDKNSVTLKFENFFNGQAMYEPSGVYTSSSSQKHQFSTLKYIVSDVILVKSDGTEVKYHYQNPDKGAYIVDQSEEAITHNFVLEEIPAGDYKQVKFGLGISPDAFILGQEKQALFWDKAKTNGMSWSWASGYKFANFEGTYSDALDKNFKIHIGNIGNPQQSKTPDVYKVITLDLPQAAKVRKVIAPKIHIMADINQFLSGKNKVVLSDDNAQAMHPSKAIVKETAENLSLMFSVDHVHNN